jgi:hypothetical protein
MSVSGARERRRGPPHYRGVAQGGLCAATRLQCFSASVCAAYNLHPARLTRRMPTLIPRFTTAWSRRRALAALGSLAAGPAAAQFRVQISGVGATQIPVALATLRDEASSGVALSAIVRADLERSGLFRMLPADGNLDERSSVDLAAWRGRGADALVAGSVARWPTAASTCATSSGTRCATNNCWARARWCWPVTCAWPRTAWPTRSTKSSPANAVSMPRASPTSSRPASASRCTSPMPMAKAARWRWPAPSPSSRRPGRPTAGNWPMCPSNRRRPWSGCRTWARASAACWPTFAAPTARRPGRPTGATWH